MDKIMEARAPAAVAVSAASIAAEPKKNRVKSFLKKVRGVKNIELIVAGVVCAAVLLFYFSSLFAPASSGASSTSFSEYVANLETNLSKILSEIKGAGKVSVMITFESGVEQVYAYSTDTQTTKNSDGAKETSVTVDKSTMVVSGGQPVIIKEIMPLIKGVIVVAEGADKVSIKLEIIKAVQALFDIQSTKIEIFAKSK